MVGAGRRNHMRVRVDHFAIGRGLTHGRRERERWRLGARGPVVPGVQCRACQRHVKALLSPCRMRNADRKSGAHRGRRGARARPKTEWESLTATQHRVVKLPRTGSRSPRCRFGAELPGPTGWAGGSHLAVKRLHGDLLYISRRRVETYLLPYRKLGIGSRTELAAAATPGDGVTGNLRSVHGLRRGPRTQGAQTHTLVAARYH